MVSARLEGRLVDRYEEAEEDAPEENKSAFLRSLIVDGLDEKDRDVLDAIDASDELREAVETRRKEGEPLDDAARRLLREGVDAPGNKPDTPRGRVANAVVVATLGAVGGVGYHLEGVAGAVVAVLGVTLLITFADVFVGAVLGLVDRLDRAGDLREELEAAREERPDVEERDREGATDSGGPRS